MKKILGLDLGVNSIGWALVNEAENDNENSSIIKLGVRVNPLTVDESQNFEKGKSITTNADRTLKRSMRRNLQRYKLRRQELIKTLSDYGFIQEGEILSENGNRTTFETYKLRALAATEQISLREFAKVLLMINKKRGYKSNRKTKDSDDGKLIDGMNLAKKLYDEDITVGQLCLQLIKNGYKRLPDFYKSDLQNELEKIWCFQRQFYPYALSDNTKKEIQGKNRTQTWAILSNHFCWEENITICNDSNAISSCEIVKKKIVGFKRNTKGFDQKIENYEWRVSALSQQMDLERLAIVIQEINAEIYSSSGYLGNISDRSKSLYFKKQTVGQYLMESINKNPNASLKNIVFYRQDYLDEFERIWETQAHFHNVLTQELKHKIRDIIIFYQRRLRSQKSLISFCEFESSTKNISAGNKTKTITTGSRVIPRSSPIFQEFKIWQTLNNIEVVDKSDHSKFTLSEEDKHLLFEELSVRETLNKTDVLKLLFTNPNEFDLNYKTIDGNRTSASFYQAFSQILELSGHEPLDFKKRAKDIKSTVYTFFEAMQWNTNIFSFESSQLLNGEPYFKHPYYKLWHLLYSFEGDNTITGDGNLKDKISKLIGIEKEYANCLTNISFIEDYGSLSAKAILKILPYLKAGNKYDVACLYAGYRHSKSSLTKEEIRSKQLKDQLDILPKNSLRNPVVEKILNQMVNVVNNIIKTYGKPDEIRVELARELKKNAKEREELTKSLAAATKEQDEIRKLLQKEFGIVNVSRNDIIRYRLYEELKENGYRTLYSNTYIPQEKLFSKEFDIEHIIPQALLFDDSFSNKTLEVRSINIEKGKSTAYDYVLDKYGEDGLKRYKNCCENLFKDKRVKLRKLLMSKTEIPSDFIERDLRNTQYIAKKAIEMLREISRRVVATTGSITDQLRRDWQLVDVLKELNWEKYHALGKVEYYQDKDGRTIGRIVGWTKRNDHRHHAMDALTVAFTKDVFIQYFNNKNASENPTSNEYAIKNKYFEAGKAISPMPCNLLRAEAKKRLQELLVSIKAKNKVVTKNINKTKSNNGIKEYTQQTPRGQLHNETIYGSHKEYVTSIEKVNASFNEDKIETVCNKKYREALFGRLQQFGGDAKKAFTGKNSLDKNPIWIDNEHGIAVPLKVKIVKQEIRYTIRKPIDENLSVEKVVDKHIRKILQNRINEYGNQKAAFANLDENPIWLNKEKGIKLKRVTIYGISNAIAIHEKKDKDGKYILNEKGSRIAIDFVNTGNNHHVAIYRRPVTDKMGVKKLDENGNVQYELEEVVVSFYEAVTRKNLGLPVIDKEYHKSNEWEFLYSMKQNEYFVFPNETTGFNPKEIDLLDPENYALISPNLFRVQKISHKNYVFRHHLETKVDDSTLLMKGISWTDFRSSNGLDTIVKVRINHIGQIESIGEY